MPMINDINSVNINQYYNQSVMPQNPVQTAEEKKVSPDGEKPAYIVDISKDAKDKNSQAKEEKKADSSEKDTTSTEFWRRGKSKSEQKSIEKQVMQLKQTNQEIIAHEQAHKATGGQYAGAISYDKTTGPDGKQYIVGGEVSIDISPETTPQKTIVKMQIVRSAALAPASPSGQDRGVAAAASSLQMQAQSELSKQTREKTAKTGMGQNENKIGENDRQVVAQEEKKQFEIQDKQKDKKNQFWMQELAKKQQDSKNKNIGTVIDLSA